MGFKDSTLNENPWSTNHTWFVNPGQKDDNEESTTTLTRFYIQAFIQFVVGWLIYMAFNYTGNSTGVFPDTARRVKITLQNLKFLADQGVCISASTASMILAVLYVTVGIVVQILNGDRHASSYSIIVLFLGTCIYRFVRMSRRPTNSWNMVPNLLTIVALSFMAMAYNNVLVESKEHGKNPLYWVSGILFGVSGVLQVAVATFPTECTQEDDAAYVIPRRIFALTTLAMTAVLIWELVLISLAKTRDYAIPYILIYALCLYVGGEIVFYLFTDRNTTQHAWNMLIFCFVTVTVVFAHINTCSAFPESAGGDSMYICGSHMHKLKPGVRITLLSSFAQVSILLFWIGFMNSGQNQMRRDNSIKENAA